MLALFVIFNSEVPCFCILKILVPIPLARKDLVVNYPFRSTHQTMTSQTQHAQNYVQQFPIQYTRSDISCQQWTSEEIEQLKRAYKIHGSNWILISKQFFPNRTPNQLKCKFNYVNRQEHKRDDLKMLDDILQAVLNPK
ncbi:Myb-like_DNA-binding domain-containing protein [Hexamita inflata]|uniref:Myb-like DNA-binding domain-containing protein n=1 Tax=Hexamita inflata TaxID=28002 RepID=A0AA86UJ03_9EUKA|nr:Myb-like DNA-binding domain-containing protein [Hexamita inflata]